MGDQADYCYGEDLLLDLDDDYERLDSLLYKLKSGRRHPSGSVVLDELSTGDLKFIASQAYECNNYDDRYEELTLKIFNGYDKVSHKTVRRTLMGFIRSFIDSELGGL